MKYLAKWRDIVILDNENYIKETNRELPDKNNYKILQTYPILQHSKKVNDTLGWFKNENLLSKKTAKGLQVININTPKFYIAPKIHKENNPGRPVIHSINCHTSEISRFVDHHIEQKLYRIKTLYTNIPNNEFIAAVKRKHNYTKKTVVTLTTKYTKQLFDTK